MTHIKSMKIQPTLRFENVKAVQYLVQTVGQSGMQINSECLMGVLPLVGCRLLLLVILGLWITLPLRYHPRDCRLSGSFRSIQEWALRPYPV